MMKYILRSRVGFFTFLILMLLMTTILSIPDENVSAVEGATSLSIKSPSVDSKINTTTPVISGTYSSDVSKSDLLFSATENESGYYSDSTSPEWIIDESNAIKTWKFIPTSPLSEGTHTLSVTIKNSVTDEEVSQTVTFTINTLLEIDNSTIQITSPATSGTVYDSNNVVISGQFNADTPINDLYFTAKVNGDTISDSLTKAGDWIIDNSSTPKTWTFTTNTLDEGDYNLSIEVKNLPIDNSANTTMDFSIFQTRPYIVKTGIVLADGTERVGEDLTNVPLDSKIKVTITDDKSMNHWIADPIKILSGSTTLNGTTEISDATYQDGKYLYDIIFTPNDKELKINKSYLVYINPEQVDDLDNPILTRLFKFTTKTNVVWDDPDDPQTHSSSNPHGHYQSNTNTCAGCHSTHESNSAFLTGGSYQLEFTEQLSNGQPVNDPSQNYCLACHDGTMNAPAMDNTSNFKHGEASEIGEIKHQESCTSCHDPHLEWSSENQNLLKDHYVYTHNELHPEQGLETLTVDSLDTSCNTCHDYIDFSGISEDKGTHEQLEYQKSITAIGTKTNKLTDSNLKTISSYSLCLRCHNAEKSLTEGTPADIEALYVKDSGHNFILPEGQQTQRDGSLLNGPLPCAECHETHGSNNLFNLREVLGNNPTVSAGDQYKTTGTAWNKENERNFCLNCHNKGTEIYGKKATINLTISGHQDINKACSECHSDQTRTYSTFREKSLNAAHAPLPGVDPTTNP